MFVQLYHQESAVLNVCIVVSLGKYCTQCLYSCIIRKVLYSMFVQLYHQESTVLNVCIVLTDQFISCSVFKVIVTHVPPIEIKLCTQCDHVMMLWLKSTNQHQQRIAMRCNKTIVTIIIIIIIISATQVPLQVLNS